MEEPEREGYIIDSVPSDLDDMREFAWDGPEDSDEEIEALLPYKNELEKRAGIRLSKRGIIQYVESVVRNESAVATDLWE